MRFDELVVGEEYIISGNQPSKNATFEGKHNGILETVDGAKIMSNAGWLKFRIVETNEILFLKNGADVVETTAAEAAREKIQAERKAAEDAALEAVENHLRKLGGDEYLTSDGRVRLRLPYMSEGTPAMSDVLLDGFTYGYLLKALDAGSGI